MPHKQLIPITQDNASQLIKIGQLGHGSFASLEWSPDSTTIAVAAHREILLYNACDIDSPPRIIATHNDRIDALAFHPFEQKLASASFDRTVRLWDISSGQCQQVFDHGKEWGNSLAFSPDGQTLVTTTSLSGNFIHFWNLKTGEQITWPYQSDGQVNSIAFSPDGTLLAIGCGYKWAGHVEIWHVFDHQLMHTMEEHTGRVEKVAFSLDGSKIFSIGAESDRSLRIWDVKSGCCLKHTHLDPYLNAESVSFNSDRSKLFFGQNLLRHSDLIMFDIVAFQKQVVGVGHPDIVSRTALSPDNQQLVSGAWDGTLRWWELETEQTRIIDENYSIGEVDQLAFDPSGSVLAAKHANTENVRLWDIVTQKLLHAPVEHYFSDIGSFLERSNKGKINVPSVSELIGDSEVVHTFSPDRTLLATGNNDGYVLLWALPEDS